MTTGLSLALALAVLIGLALGLIGGGGAIVTLPVLVYVAGIQPQTAVSMSIAIVGATGDLARGQLVKDFEVPRANCCLASCCNWLNSSRAICAWRSGRRISSSNSLSGSRSLSG